MKRPWSTPVLEALQVPRPYVTKRDVIGFEILPALGEYADDHHIDAIVDACFEYGPGGYVQTVDTEQFWQYVEAAAIEQA